MAKKPIFMVKLFINLPKLFDHGSLYHWENTSSRDRKHSAGTSLMNYEQNIVRIISQFSRPFNCPLHHPLIPSKSPSKAASQRSAPPAMATISPSSQYRLHSALPITPDGAHHSAAPHIKCLGNSPHHHTSPLLLPP